MTSCSSSVSVQRSSKTEDQRSKSCDTACSSNSSCFFQRRKPINPLMFPVRPNFTRNSGNTVRQRVMSAKLLKMRSLQNQLNDANFHLSELSKENQILKNLQKRQDKALSKYEGMNEDLPRLLRSHEDQTRTLSEKNKSLRKNVRELNELLKVREDELARVQEKLNHLEKLNKDKHLIDREKLMEQLEDMKIKLQKSDDQVAFLNRKLMLEAKASKQRLNSEVVKHKQCQKQLNQAMMEIERLTGVLETKENMVQPKKNRFTHLGHRQSMSMVTLPTSNGIPNSNKLTSIKNNPEIHGSKSAVTDVKLEPIKCTKLEDVPEKKTNGILNLPSENIKNRLSFSAHSRGSGDSFSLNDIKEQSSGSEISLDLREDLTGESTEIDNKQLLKPKESTICNNDGKNTSQSMLSHKTSKTDSTENHPHRKTRTSSNTKLEKLTSHLDKIIQKGIENGTEEFDSKLGDLCSDVITNVRVCSEKLEVHKERLKKSNEDTNMIFESFKKTKMLESRLKNSLLNYEDDEVGLVNEILSEELKFQSYPKDDKGMDKNGNVTKKEPRVNSEDKKKLLATLKAIDNGDSIESLNGSPTHRHMNVTKEIFSDIK